MKEKPFDGRARVSIAAVAHAPQTVTRPEISGRWDTTGRIEAMTICHFSTVHTELKSRSFHRECLPLAAAGICVRYLSPAEINGCRDGVEFIPVPARINRMSRAFRAVCLLRKLLQQNADLYHFQDLQLLPLAFVLKVIFRKRVVYDAYEDFPSMALNKTSIPRRLRPFAAKVIGGVERLAAYCLDGLMTADPFTLRRLARTGRSRKLVFYNFPNLDFFPPPRPVLKRFDAVYRGGLSERTGALVLLEAMRMLLGQKRRVRLLMIGYFDCVLAEREMRERINAMGLAESIELRGRLRHEDMAEALSQARMGVSTLQDIPKFRLNIPVKVFEYWACGLPVVASDLPSIRPFFRAAQAGILFPAHNAAELARSIGWMFDHPVQAELMGQKGRAAIVRQFNNRNEVRKLRRFCMRVTRRPELA